MLHIRAALLAVIVHFLPVLPVVAQDITLTSRDGSVEISGSLVGYDGEFYRVDTAYGILTIDGSGVLCDGSGCPDLTAFVAKVRLAGAPSMGLVLMPALLEAFASQQDYSLKRIVIDDTRFTYVLSDRDKEQDVAEFEFQISSSDEGFADILADEADIVLSNREILADEIALGKDAGLGNLGSSIQSSVIALDGLVPVVSGKNPVQSISPNDLYDIFSGKIINWQNLGGVDAPIELHLGNSSLALTQVFQDYIHQSGSVLSENTLRHATVVNLVDEVAKDPFAIGISTLSELGNTKRLNLSGSCGFKAIANRVTLTTEDYPLTAPMFVYLPARRLPAIVREFFRFTRSPKGQSAAQRAGFAGQLLSEIPISHQGNRFSNAILAAGDDVSLAELQRMVTALDDARRLSVSFRFEDGSSELDAQSRSNIVLIARSLESGKFDEREVIFAGFSDGKGAAKANTRLSRERAISVRAAVLREAATADLSRINVSVEAFGEAMPMACDDTHWGRRVNRRVEVWVR